jgi:hypothetical protein
MDDHQISNPCHPYNEEKYHLLALQEAQKQSCHCIILGGLGPFKSQIAQGFASFLMELDSNKTNKKRSKETDPTRRVCVKMVEGAYCKGP